MAGVLAWLSQARAGPESSFCLTCRFRIGALRLGAGPGLGGERNLGAGGAAFRLGASWGVGLSRVCGPQRRAVILGESQKETRRFIENPASRQDSPRAAGTALGALVCPGVSCQQGGAWLWKPAGPCSAAIQGTARKGSAGKRGQAQPSDGVPGPGHGAGGQAGLGVARVGLWRGWDGGDAPGLGANVTAAGRRRTQGRIQGA